MPDIDVTLNVVTLTIKSRGVGDHTHGQHTHKNILGISNYWLVII